MLGPTFGKGLEPQGPKRESVVKDKLALVRGINSGTSQPQDIINEINNGIQTHKDSTSVTGHTTTRPTNHEGLREKNARAEEQSPPMSPEGDVGRP